MRAALLCVGAGDALPRKKRQPTQYKQASGKLHETAGLRNRAHSMGPYDCNQGDYGCHKRKLLHIVSPFSRLIGPP
jgi:hypothetical protein